MAGEDRAPGSRGTVRARLIISRKAGHLAPNFFKRSSWQLSETNLEQQARSFEEVHPLGPDRLHRYGKPEAFGGSTTKMLLSLWRSGSGVPAHSKAAKAHELCSKGSALVCTITGYAGHS